MLMWTAVVAGAAAGLASIPHCTAMCGSLAAYACSGTSNVDGQVRYQLGRFISYSLMGAIVGTMGGATAVALPAGWGSALLSWSLALGLALAALRLWKRPADPLVTLRTKDASQEASPAPVKGFVAALGRNPFLVGLGTALLPCGALASAALIAASTGSAGTGAVSMLAFSIVSGFGLIGVSWLYGRFARQPRPSTARALAVVLALGAIVFVIRPMHALQHQAHGHAHSESAPADHGGHEAP